MDVRIDEGGLLELVGGSSGARKLTMLLGVKVDFATDLLNRGSGRYDMIVDLASIGSMVLERMEIDRREN